MLLKPADLTQITKEMNKICTEPSKITLYQIHGHQYFCLNAKFKWKANSHPHYLKQNFPIKVQII